MPYFQEIHRKSHFYVLSPLEELGIFLGNLGCHKRPLFFPPQLKNIPVEVKGEILHVTVTKVSGWVVTFLQVREKWGCFTTLRFWKTFYTKMADTKKLRLGKTVSKMYAYLEK